MVLAVSASSPSSRRAWIEMLNIAPKWNYCYVALLAEGVDRNIDPNAAPYAAPGSPSSRRAWIEISTVVSAASYVSTVALLAEGVDRNILPDLYDVRRTMSPSSRRAWIEIWRYPPCSAPAWVALLAEGVDRNRAWPATLVSRAKVALLAEGVDRNKDDDGNVIEFEGRPPRGGRG